MEGAISRPYQGFTFRRKNYPEMMPNGAARVEVALQYLGKPWGTVQVDVARHEGDGAEVEMVEAISLAPFGIAGPGTLPCLSLPYHIAQKIHGMTLPPKDGRRNERFRDLVDLLLLREWVSDFEAVRRACREVFEIRGTHPWPPLVGAAEHWAEPFRAMAIEMELDTLDLHEAILAARSFIYDIDETAPLVASKLVSGGISATTWYYVVGPDGTMHRVSTSIGEGISARGEVDVSTIPDHWQRVPGGIALIGVVVILQNRKPLFVERAFAEGFALHDETLNKPVAFTPAIWLALAKDLLKRSKAPVRAVRALAVFLSRVQGILPCMLATEMRISTREAHKYFADYLKPSPSDGPLWDLWLSQPIRRAIAE